MPKLTSLFLSASDYEYYIELAQKSNMPFTLTESNYRIQIESAFINRVFNKNMLGKMAFVAGRKIESDIKKTGLETPNISYTRNYLFSNDLNRSEKIYCIDLKSAYAQTLYNFGLISENTLSLLSKIRKPDRLAAVGMLASNSYVYTCKGDKTLSTEHKRKITSGWFFFCVAEIQKLMENIAAIIGKSFIFFWVDGIFFENKKDFTVISEIIKKTGYGYTVENCTNYFYDGKKLSFCKENGVRKEFFIPENNNPAHEYLIKILNK